MSLKFTITTTEALELVQYHNPKGWQNDLVAPTIDLSSFRVIHRLSHRAALTAMTTIKSNMAKNIYLMAAFQHTMDCKVKEYHKIQEQISMYTAQLSHLISSPFSNNNKAELKSHYREKLELLAGKKLELLEIKEVRNSLNVESATITPSNHEKT